MFRKIPNIHLISYIVNFSHRKYNIYGHKFVFGHQRKDHGRICKPYPISISICFGLSFFLFVPFRLLKEFMLTHITHERAMRSYLCMCKKSIDRSSFINAIVAVSNTADS